MKRLQQLLALMLVFSWQFLIRLFFPALLIVGLLVFVIALLIQTLTPMFVLGAFLLLLLLAAYRVADDEKRENKHFGLGRESGFEQCAGLVYWVCFLALLVLMTNYPVNKPLIAVLFAAGIAALVLYFTRSELFDDYGPRLGEYRPRSWSSAAKDVVALWLALLLAYGLYLWFAGSDGSGWLHD